MDISYLPRINEKKYIGRFAPSPTGPLHYGSLISAVASYLQAKKNQGSWLLRIEDIDPSRESKGASDTILRTLELFNFEWDQSPLFQSTRLDIYQNVINKLQKANLIYACSCTRKELDLTAQHSILGKRYPEICKNKNLKISDTSNNIRLKALDNKIQFFDEVFGAQKCNIYKDIGDYVIYRKLGLPTYALAVTIDDAKQGVTQVVRGYDLLSFTPLQIYLCGILDLPVPKFLHVPLILNKDGKKLSKQTKAESLENKNPSKTLTQALIDLGQNVPDTLAKESLSTIWSWANEYWDQKKIPAIKGKYSDISAQKSGLKKPL